MGVPCGKKWASDALVLLRNPVITAPAHRGMAMNGVIGLVGLLIQ